jgi:hypothetical protein
VGDSIKIDPAVLEQPAARFTAGATSLGQIGQAVKAAMRDAGEAARHPVVTGASDSFGEATAAVLDSFGAECTDMAGKLRTAGIRYHVADETAMVVQLAETTIDPGGRR